MNKKKTFSSMLLSGAMLMTMSTSVFAAGPATGTVKTIATGTPEAPAKATVTKNLEFAEGITVPGYSFDFTAKGVTKDAPTATINSATYTKGEATGTLDPANRVYNVEKTSEVKFASAFPHAGLYEYDVTENQGADNGMTYSKKQYRLRVYVANHTDSNGNNKLYIKSVTAQDEGGKQDKLSFKNTYRRNGGEEDKDKTKQSEALIIEKQTVGDLADKTKLFDFKLKLTKAGTTEDNTVTGKIIGDNRNEKVEFTYGAEQEFKLRDGDKLVFEKLPAGTRYKAVEVGANDGYTPTVNVIENGQSHTATAVTEEADLSSVKEGTDTSLVGEKQNKVTFVNKYQDVSVTGVITNNMPFIVLAGLSAGAFIVLSVAKKKKISE